MFNFQAFVSLWFSLGRSIYIMGLLILGSINLLGQQGPIKHLTIEQGLSNNSVRAVLKDQNGFLWFGTYDGLSRYDGYGFKVFRNKLKEVNSLPHNYIYALAEDAKHQVWVGTGQGIGVYSNLTGNFHPVMYQAGNSKPEPVRFNVCCIKADKKGAVYFGSNGWGFYVQEPGQEVAHQIQIQINGKWSWEYDVRQILVDEMQRIWLFIDKLGLCRYDSSKKEIVLVNNQLIEATTLLLDGHDRIWVGSNKGLFLFDLEDQRYLQSYTNSIGPLNTIYVTALALDNKGRLWIGTENAGITILDFATQQLSYLTASEKSDGLNSASVYSICIDEENRVWIGTIKGGVNMLDPQKKAFTTISHDPLETNTLISNFVSAFFEDDAGRIWIGTEGAGMSIWDPKSNTFLTYAAQLGDHRRLTHNWVPSIKKDSFGSVWVATFGGGINRFDAHGNFKKAYKCINPHSGLENPNVWLLYEDHQKRLWASTFGNGKMYLYNRSSDRFELLDEELRDIISLTQDQEDRIWAGNSHTLYKIEPISHKHVSYEIGKPIRALYQDQKQRLWVGTEGRGLLLFDPNTGKILKSYSEDDGLCSNSILNLQEDQSGMLWMSTFNGLSRLDPATGKFQNFYQSDGLQSNQFIYSAGLKLRSGAILFGGINGFNVFQPSKILTRNFFPPVYITSIRINNRELSDHPEFVKETHDGWFQTLSIPYNQAVLSVDFAALEFTSPEKIHYSTFLEGWDNEWNKINDIRTINYSNLSEGTYWLRIRASSAEGEWNPRESRLKIIILPPWYRSGWAYGLYILLAASLIYLYLQYKSRQNRLKYEISLAKMEAENERDLNEKKLAFFTNISHEFRTPLTLIINPIKDLINEEVKLVGKASSELSLVYRNARRLLSLADQLLIFRKIEKENSDLKLSVLNFRELCQEVFLSFSQEAKAKKINYKFHCSAEELNLHGDREKLEIIFYNLLSNALKYTPEGGQIDFSIDEEIDEIIVRVRDTGFGIPKETGTRLFEKFFQVKSRNHRSETGFGIGLYLVNQFTLAHKGRLDYESELSKGTCFRLVFLKGTAHFGTDVLLEDAVPSKLYQEIAMAEEADLPNKKVVEEIAGLDEVVSDQKSILVVDDNEAIRSYIVNLFSTEYRVLSAASAEEALHLCQKLTPDLIISDIVMDGISGIEFCKKIKQDPSMAQVPVILLTGNSTSEVQLKSMEGGADDYITKPFEKDILLARVQNLLKKRNDLQHYFYNVITLQANNTRISQEHKEFLESCIRIVEEHLEQDDFNIQMLADELGISYSKLYKKIKLMSGQSTNAFIRFIRLRKAAEMFIHSQQNVNETAFIVGIRDVKYFRKQFQQTFGMNPSEYIDKYRKAFGKNYTVDGKMKK